MNSLACPRFPRISRGLLLALLISAAASSSNFTNARPAAKAPPAQLQFERTYRDNQALQVSFLETYEENGRVLRSEAGTAYFRRPSKMRFEYAAPEKNVFLVDGKTAWFYVPSDHTATRVPARQSSDWKTPLALLAGDAHLDRICSRVTLAAAEHPIVPDGVVLQCLLKGTQAPDAAHDPSDIQSGTVFLEVSPITGQLSRVLIQDFGGITVEFQFKNWQFNPALPESLFRFSPPPGTAIVNGELPAALASTKQP